MPLIDKLFDLSAERRGAMPQKLMLPLGIDTHVHGRTPDDGRSQMVISACADQFEAIIDIPNVPGVQTGDDFDKRRSMLQSYVPEGSQLAIYGTPLINDNTDPVMLKRSWRKKQIAGIKIFWEGVSNAYGQYITSTKAIEKIIRSSSESSQVNNGPLRITIHAECLKDYDGNILPIRDREFWCIENEVEAMLKMNPDGIYIIRHVSDYRTLGWIRQKWAAGFRIYAEISPQYMVLIDDDLFRNDDGHAELQCDCVFWPRPKDGRSRKANQDIILECPPWIIYGSDFAMHLHDPSKEGGVKINRWGKAVGGLNFLPKVAKSVLIDFCLSNGKPEVLKKLLLINPSNAYGLKLAGTEVEYVRKDWTVPDYTEAYINKDGCETLHVQSLNFLRGQTMHWERA